MSQIEEAAAVKKLSLSKATKPDSSAKLCPRHPHQPVLTLYSPVCSDFCSSIPPQPLSPSSCAWESVITKSPRSDTQMQAAQLERVVASVPALYSDACDIA